MCVISQPIRVEKHRVHPYGATDRCRKDTAINKNKQAMDEHGLPYLTLEVDGLTSRNDRPEKQLEPRPSDATANDEPAPGASIQASSPGNDGLEVYGWETSLWRKIRGYFGF